MLTGDFVIASLVCVLAVTACVGFYGCTARKSEGSQKVGDDRFRAFQRTYLVVYLTAMMADWLQGPYVYALYESYGFSRGDNALLFTAGFGSSALFGTFVGSLADRMGRRRFAALYCVLYAISCLTKHVKNFSFLLLGRVTGGIATSLLFSVFDSWMVAEHNQRNFDSELLGNTFALAVWGNSVVAIVAGEVGQLVADMKELTVYCCGDLVHWGGYCSPFDVAILCLGLCLIALGAHWSENYGQRASGNGGAGTLQEMIQLATATIRDQPQVLYCGIICSCFESSMFIFVFMWTPALTEEGAAKPPYGHIFASFMVMCMLGSQIFSLESGKRSVEAIGKGLLALAAVCHTVPVLTADPALRYISFLLFEMCVGLYFPMMGTLKGIIVPEESRSAIYNLYRVPLNIIVVASLVAKLELQTAFIFTTTLLLTALFFQARLAGARRAAATHYRPVGVDTEFGLDDDIGELAVGKPDAEAEMATILGNKL